ncbi:MAG: hypothetical protein HeimC3_06860 [Candidatus Heimdallarchaeota archaeon LC_3]|nr:MAG: hypothetical protein HeimC3_06860 [Candidatus Heimdallarchaeota archaeon LC_3]
MISAIENMEIISNFSSIYHEDISSIFRLVRNSVWLFMRKTRPGILLGLVELGFDRGNFIGGLHYSGTNQMFLNKSALRVMQEESGPDEYKAYLYFLIMHEYIHSIGYYDEMLTRKITKEIILKIFGEAHILGKLAINGLNYYFPYTFNQRRYQPTQKELLNPEYVTLHQSESELTYI